MTADGEPGGPIGRRGAGHHREPQRLVHPGKLAFEDDRGVPDLPTGRGRRATRRREGGGAQHRVPGCPDQRRGRHPPVQVIAKTGGGRHGHLVRGLTAGINRTAERGNARGAQGRRGAPDGRNRRGGNGRRKGAGRLRVGQRAGVPAGQSRAPETHPGEREFLKRRLRPHRAGMRPYDLFPKTAHQLRGRVSHGHRSGRGEHQRGRGPSRFGGRGRLGRLGPRHAICAGIGRGHRRGGIGRPQRDAERITVELQQLAAFVKARGHRVVSVRSGPARSGPTHLGALTDLVMAVPARPGAGRPPGSSQPCRVC